MVLPFTARLRRLKHEAAFVLRIRFCRLSRPAARRFENARPFIMFFVSPVLSHLRNRMSATFLPLMKDSLLKYADLLCILRWMFV